MGGKPSPGTKKDKRLKENKEYNPSKVSTKKQSKAARKDKALIFQKMTGSKPADPTK